MTDVLLDVMVDYQAGRARLAEEESVLPARRRRTQRVLALCATDARTAHLRSALASFGVSHRLVDSCREAREQLEGGDFTVVVTDASLPDGNWCDVLDHVVRKNIDVEVVVLTDRARETTVSEIVSRGALPAPVSDFAALRDGIAKAMWPETQARASRASACD